jgi:hypothetical protein
MSDTVMYGPKPRPGEFSPHLTSMCTYFHLTADQSLEVIEMRSWSSQAARLQPWTIVNKHNFHCLCE